MSADIQTFSSILADLEHRYLNDGAMEFLNHTANEIYDLLERLRRAEAGGTATDAILTPEERSALLEDGENSFDKGAIRV